jgi:hypothetical protein
MMPDKAITAPVLLAAAAANLGLALQIRNGRMHPVALLFMSVALALVVRAIRGPAIVRLERAGARAVELAVGLAVAAALVCHLLRFPSSHFAAPGMATRLPIYLGLLLLAALVLAAFHWPAWRPGLRLPLAIALYLAVGGFILREVPDPPIDVFIFQRDAAAALLAGQNPYTLTFPNIYGEHTPYYGPEMVRGGRLQFGFVYPPWSLLMVIPGQLLGDVRISHLLATAGSAALMGYARPGRLGFLAATLYLFLPRSFFVLELGWTEPLVVALLALVMFCACRAPRGLPWALGLFLVSKQYLVLAVPALFRLVEAGLDRRGLRRAILGAIGLGALVSLPLALWSFRPFWYSVGALQAHQPFRMDALSFPAAFAWLTGLQAPSLLAFAMAGLAMVISWRRCPATPSGVCTTLALTYFAFFAFNKQAFCNYYHFVLGLLCLALATYQTPLDAPDRAHARDTSSLEPGATLRC